MSKGTTQTKERAMTRFKWCGCLNLFEIHQLRTYSWSYFKDINSLVSYTI